MCEGTVVAACAIAILELSTQLDLGRRDGETECSSQFMHSMCKCADLTPGAIPGEEELTQFRFHWSFNASFPMSKIACSMCPSAKSTSAARAKQEMLAHLCLEPGGVQSYLVE